MISAIALMVAAQAVSPAPPTPTISAARGDDWTGTLTLPSQATLRIAVHIRVDRDGILRGSSDSLDQRVWNIPLDSVVMTATTLDFAVPSNGSRYSGDGTRLHGAGSAS